MNEGIALAIGTDGPASNNCLDMFREMFLTTALAKLRENDAACVPDARRCSTWPRAERGPLYGAF